MGSSFSSKRSKGFSNTLVHHYDGQRFASSNPVYVVEKQKHMGFADPDIIICQCGRKIRISQKTYYREKKNFSSYENSFEDQEKGQKMMQLMRVEREKIEGLIEKYEKNIKQAKEYGRKMKDPACYQEFKKQSLNTYIQELKKLKLPEFDIGEDKICRKLIVEKVSSGKSSLINKLFATKLEVGIGETTEEPTEFYNQDNVLIYDTPGENQKFNTQTIENIMHLTLFNQVFICYPDSLKNIEHLVRVIWAIKPAHTIFIRTQCDMASQTHRKTLEQEIQEDHRILSGWGIRGASILATSAKLDGYQNGEVKRLLTRYPS